MAKNKRKILKKQTIKIAIQINGKTREIVEIQKDLEEKASCINNKKNTKK